MVIIRASNNRILRYLRHVYNVCDLAQSMRLPLSLIYWLVQQVVASIGGGTPRPRSRAVDKFEEAPSNPSPPMQQKYILENKLWTCRFSNQFWWAGVGRSNGRRATLREAWQRDE